MTRSQVEEVGITTGVKKIFKLVLEEQNNRGGLAAADNTNGGGTREGGVVLAHNDSLKGGRTRRGCSVRREVQNRNPPAKKMKQQTMKEFF